MSRAGTPVNGLYAVARAVRHDNVCKTPARGVAMVDRAGRDWPALLVSQLEQLPALLRELGVTVIEAGDEVHVVASYTRAAVAAGDDVVIVGVDKRFAQLVTKNRSGGTTRTKTRATRRTSSTSASASQPRRSATGWRSSATMIRCPASAASEPKARRSCWRRTARSKARWQRWPRSKAGRAKHSRPRATTCPLSLRTLGSMGRANCRERSSTAHTPRPNPRCSTRNLDALGFVELLASVATSTRARACATRRKSSTRRCKPWRMPRRACSR